MTTSRETEQKSARYAPWIVGLLIALPTLVLRFPPMTDLPLHEALVATMRHFYDPTYYPPGLYKWNLGHPNQLFHLVAYALSWLVGTTWACKITVALAQIGVILAGARLADYLGVPRWTALLLSPLVLGWTYLWGLVANLLGFVVFLAALPTLDRSVEKPSARNALASSGFMLLLYMAHESVMVIASVAVFIFTLGHPIALGSRKGLRDLALRFAAPAFAVVLFVAQQAVQHRMMGEEEATATTWSSFTENIYELPGTLTGSGDLLVNGSLVSLLLLAIASFAVARWKSRDPNEARPSSLRERLHRYRFETLATLCAIAYFCTPFGYAGGSMFNHRYYHPALALFALTLAPQVARRVPSMLERVLCCAVPIAFLLVRMPDMLHANENYRELEDLATDVPFGSSLAYLDLDPSANKHEWAATPSAVHVLALRGGRMMFSFASYSVIAPIQTVPQYTWKESIDRVVMNSRDMIPAHDLHLFKYILVRSEDHRLLALAPRILPEARFIKASGDWELFESLLPTIPLLSPDPGPPRDPTPMNVTQRTIMLLREGAKHQAAGAQ